LWLWSRDSPPPIWSIDFRLSASTSNQKTAPREAGDTPIRIVDIDDNSLKTIGQWPWPRAVLAQQHFDYSLLGDPLNHASRLEGLGKVYGMIW
jgi:hypothetical protein